MKFFATIVSSLIVFVANAAPCLAEGAMKIKDIHGVSSLSACKVDLTGVAAQKIEFYQFSCDARELGWGQARVAIICQSDKGMTSTHLRPFLANKCETTSQVAIKNKALAAVNGGFFNLSDGVSASYVTLSGKVAADPTQNKALTGNVKLQKFLPQIYDRSELRLLKNQKSGVLSYQICPHAKPVLDGFKLLDALQGGPRLLPGNVAQIGLSEAFLRREADGSLSDSIGVKRTAARTAVGISKAGRVFIISVAGPKQDEFSSGLNLAATASILERLGCEQAINFDGGTSTTLVVRGLASEGANALTLAADQKRINDDYCMVVGREPETLVKSTLALVAD